MMALQMRLDRIKKADKYIAGFTTTFQALDCEALY